VIMGNVTHILPVLHCLKRGIAFVSSWKFPSLSSGERILKIGADFGFFRPAGATRCTNQIWQRGADRRFARPSQIRTWSVQGWGFTAPKTEKKSNFTNIIAPKGRVPCTIFTKFTYFMRVLSLHNVTKFGCFISINDKIINNLLRWGRFQPNFRRPLAAKLWMRPKNI